METVLLKNVVIKWPFLAKKNDKGEYASNKYQVDIVLNKDDEKLLEGIINKRQKIKERDGERVITLKSSVKPRVYNADKVLMTDDELTKVGNGSIAHVKITKYNTKKFGEFAGLGSIKVLSVKEYVGDDDFGDDDDVSEESFDSDEELI